jgi:hypothetical protein
MAITKKLPTEMLGLWPAQLDPKRLQSVLRLRQPERFALFPVEKCFKETQELELLAGTEQAGDYALHSAEDSQEPRSPGFVDAGALLVIGGSTAAEDSLALLYSELHSEPSVVYLAIEGEACWTEVASSLRDFLNQAANPA